jgi:glycosyltransferase involved in cell wall biosynthesis
MFVIYSMMAGGAERVAATLVNHWVDGGDELTLVTITSSDFDFYELDGRIDRVALDLARASRSWWESLVNNGRIIMRIRKVMRRVKPDVVLSFIDVVNLRVLVAAFGTGIPVVVEEHIDPAVYSIGRVATVLRRLLYRRARAVVVLTPGIAQWVSRIVAQSSLRVIPNPVGEQFLKPSQLTKPGCGHKIVGMGRLELQKGFDLLLRAFAQCVHAHPGWTLDIVGEGSEGDRLRALAEDLEIGSKVVLRGVIKDTERILREADLFVLSSRYEGFPMALLEAMASGLPVVSFDCRSGPREMIHDGVNGVLVAPNDVEALAKAMDRLMSADDERERLGEQAVGVAEKFSLAKINQMWRSVFEEAVSGYATARH